MKQLKLTAVEENRKNEGMLNPHTPACKIRIDSTVVKYHAITVKLLHNYAINKSRNRDEH